jgi:hypothetical protein
LQIVLRSKDDRDVQCSMSGPAPVYQQRIPRDDGGRGDEQSPQHVAVAARLGQESERGESHSDRRRDAWNERAYVSSPALAADFLGEQTASYEAPKMLATKARKLKTRYENAKSRNTKSGLSKKLSHKWATSNLTASAP